jgi:DnaJ-class molecular chaperone
MPDLQQYEDDDPLEDFINQLDDEICKGCDGTGEKHGHLCKDCGGRGSK